MKISLTHTQDGYESKEVAFEFTDMFYALEEYNPIHGGQYLCVVPMAWARADDPVIAFAIAMDYGSYFGEQFDAILYEYRGRPEHIQMKFANEVLRIRMNTEARLAWEEFRSSLPTVAYRALHGFDDDKCEFGSEIKSDADE